MTIFFVIFLICIAAQRLSELLIARQHEKFLKVQGAVEFGSNHYPWVVILMSFFFVALPFEYFFLKTQSPPYWPILFILILLTQALRFWSMKSLGKRWTTRIWILPNTSPLRKGPYRFIKHPNYVAVSLELILIPWLFGCYYTLVVFTGLYWLWLRTRLKVENTCLMKGESDGFSKFL